MGHLRNFKQHIGAIVPIKEQELLYYKQFSEFLQKYEETQDKSQVVLGSQAQVNLVKGDSQSHLKNKLDTLASSL